MGSGDRVTRATGRGGTARFIRFRPTVFTAISLATALGAVGLWHLGSRNADPVLLPTPAAVWDATWELASSGELWDAVGTSVRRVMIGWVIGCALAIPLGVLAGASKSLRAVIDPFIHFFRFVPALALVSLFLLWFGIGESSKTNLIAYASAFVVVVTTASGASSVPTDKIDAARCFGASRAQVLRDVVIPSSVPSIVTGMRLALANAFLVIMAAEALATQSGIGFLVWNARTFFRTDQIFVGVLCFGVLGFTADRLWRLVSLALLGRYLRRVGDY